MDKAVENNQMAVVSIVSAAIAWVIGGIGSCAVTFLFPPVSLCTGIVFLVGSIVATVTGHMGRKQISESGGRQGGDGMALGGLILGWIGIVIIVLMICLVILSVAGLTLLGPQIGDVFSNIVDGLEAQP